MSEATCGEDQSAAKLVEKSVQKFILLWKSASKKWKTLSRLLINSMMKFPGSAKRSAMIAELLKGSDIAGKCVLNGRVIGLLDGEGWLGAADLVGVRGFILEDFSGKIVIESEDLPKVGVILEVEVWKTDAGKWKKVGQARILADCEDFFISPISSPNYQRMIIDQKLKENLLMRGKVMGAIREFFQAREFVEVDTPCLVKLPGMEPYLDVFKTRLEADFAADQKVNEELYLITSPEYAMKKLLVGGMEKIFQITRSFRNKETFSERHNPEFTILEWYRAYASYLEIMDDTEQLVKFVWDKLASEEVEQRIGVNVLGKWKKLRVIEAFAEVGINEETFFDLTKFQAAARERGYSINAEASFDDCFFAIFMNEIEPKLGMDVPVILYDYPVSMAALSKPCQEDERFAERFEVYIGGLEMCNAFTELNDPEEQEKRLRAERDDRKLMGKALYDVDESFVKALRLGMPPAGGNALGVDRLIMLIAGEKDIRNALYFPYRDL